MPGLGHHRAKAVPSDKNRAEAGADWGRSGARRQQPSPCPALGLCKNHGKDITLPIPYFLLPQGKKEWGVYCLKN